MPLNRFNVALLLKHANALVALWMQFIVVSVALALEFVIAGTDVPALIMQLLKVNAPVPVLMTAALFAFALLPDIVPLLTINEACADNEIAYGIAALLFTLKADPVIFPFTVICAVEAAIIAD